MAADTKRSLGDVEDTAQNMLPAAKQRKLDEVKNTMDMDDHLYDIEVKLYSDAKAARNDPKPPGYYERLYQELFAKDCGGDDGAATTTPNDDDSGGAAVGPGELTGDTPAKEETTQPSDVVQRPTNAITQRSSSVKSADDPNEEDFDDRLEDGSESYSDEDEYEDEGEGEDKDEDEDDEDFDAYEEWDWLEAINSFAYSKQPSPELARTELTGACDGKLIRRDRMRQNFYHEIEEPSRETSLMGFDLFDRYGRLKPEFKDHPIKKGSGIWGKELDYGDILLIEQIQVQKSHRRQGLGSKLVTAILEKTRNKTKSFIAITWPASLNREPRLKSLLSPM